VNNDGWKKELVECCSENVNHKDGQVPCCISDGVFMNVELNYKIWVVEVTEKAGMKVLGARRSLNFYEGHPYGRLYVRSDHKVSVLLFIYHK
jgi:hypothetical protein